MEAGVALGYGSFMSKHADKEMPKHTDREIAEIQKDYDAVVGEHVAASMKASEKAAHHMTLREAFDQVCVIATTMKLGVRDHDEAVAKVNEIRSRVAHLQ
jgi:hypothetical protein